MTPLSSRASGPMTPLRKTALVAGASYMITFISVPTLSLYGPIHDPNYVLGTGADTGILLGCVLEIIVALGGIATAVVLYPVLKKQNESAALSLAGSRILEAATIFFGVACLLAAVALRQSGAGHDALVASRTLVIMYDRIFLIGQSFLPVVDDLLLGFLLYHLRIVPRVLPVIGIAGAFMLLTADVAVLFGFIPQRDPMAMMPAIPVAFFEFSLGLWLVFKGFRHSPKLSGVMNQDA